jgi:hypothetical protein
MNIFIPEQLNCNDNIDTSTNDARTTYKAPLPRDRRPRGRRLKTTLHNTQAEIHARHNAQRYTSKLKILEPKLRKLTDVDREVGASKRP